MLSVHHLMPQDSPHLQGDIIIHSLILWTRKPLPRGVGIPEQGHRACLGRASAQAV